MAPEVLSRSNINAGPGIDIWALGVMLYVMIIGELPFDGETEEEIVDQILKKKLKFKNTKPISNELKDLLSKVLTKDADKRITMYELQNHPWMEMADDDLLDSIEKSKLEEEEENKEDEKDDKDDFDDLEYLSKLTLEQKKSVDLLSPKESGSSTTKAKKSGISPRGDRKGSQLNGSMKKKKPSKNKKPKVSK